MVQRHSVATQMLERLEGGQLRRLRRYPDPVDAPDTLVSGQSLTSADDPLILALREENASLRAKNLMQDKQMTAVRAAQEELAGHLQVAAPCAGLHHRAGEKRRKAGAARLSDAMSDRTSPATSPSPTSKPPATPYWLGRATGSPASRCSRSRTSSSSSLGVPVAFS